MHAATFQRGFAGRIGETHLHPGLKLRCCPDSDRGILPSAVVRFNRTAEVHKQKHTRHVHVGTRNLLPPEHITSPGSSAAFEQRRSALKPCHSANTWHPSGIIKTGHAPEPPSFTAPSYPPPPPPSQRSLATVSAPSPLLPLLLPITLTPPSAWNGADRKRPKVLVRGQNRLSARRLMADGEDEGAKAPSRPPSEGRRAAASARINTTM